MEIKKSEFVTSAANSSQFINDGKSEIAFVGRSNVGKSSLINSLTNRKKLAKVSNLPGRTRLVNYFLINDSFYFVDLPGYGFAKVSKEEKKNWGKVINEYLLKSPGLKMVVLLVDSRHEPTEDDVLMMSWLLSYNVKTVIVGTKLDKISNNEKVKSERTIRQKLKLDKECKVMFISSQSKKGIPELIECITSDL